MQADGVSRGAWRALAILTLVYTLNIADRYVLSTLIEPIKAEFALSDAAVGFLTGVALAIFYVTAGIPLGALADRVNRRNMIAVAIAAWSFFTLLGGMSQNFWQLLLTRLGVGIGEAGGTPPSQSLLGDEFSARHRAGAMSIFAIGATIGSAVGAAGAAWIAEHHGWRAALIAFGVAGLPLALLVRLGMREPKRGALEEDREPSQRSGVLETLRFIWTNRPLFHLVAGATVITFAGMGMIWWTPAFLARAHGLTVGEAGIALGAMNLVGGGLVMVATAVILARLEPRDVRWNGWFVVLIGVPMTIAAVAGYAAPNRTVSIAMLWIFVPLANAYIGPTFALAQTLVPPPMRGQVVAVILFAANLANLVIAPQLIGALSDLARAQLAAPEKSLGVVLSAASLTGFWAVAHYWMVARTIQRTRR